MRVSNVYDINNKTYLIKLARAEEKAVLLIESGIRIHSTEYDWPKSVAPSSFSMKMRKHLKSRRLEKIEQLGIDRIVDMQFGSNEAAYHIILELYDKGNIVLTDHEYIILNILRPRTDDSQDVKFLVKEKYPIHDAKQYDARPPEAKLAEYLSDAKDGDNLRKLLIPHTAYGGALLEHCLLNAGFASSARFGKELILPQDLSKLVSVLQQAEDVMQKIIQGSEKAIITQKSEKKPKSSVDGENSELLTYVEFHPMLFAQFEKSQYVEFDLFDKAIDEFFSKIESQKLEVKTLQQEKAALKKLENVQKDHEKRLDDLRREQENDKLCAQIIELNLELVDRAITVISSAIANQLSWDDIEELVAEAKAAGDVVASSIKTLHLDSNHITMLLGNGDDIESLDEKAKRKSKLSIDIDLSLSAYANARKYYEKKRSALTKEVKTIDASHKALKSAEKKTVEMLKEVQVSASINKARKSYWFEKFLWLISSDNMIIIGGRDRQQNELIVRKYLRKGDLYVHADLHGASSIVIKNPSGTEVPPRTLMEAGSMALCNSAAWEAKIVTSAWWVYDHQVSKTAPAGEYLTSGSFMIRGKKNYLPHSQLIYGFGLLFKLDESCIERHKGERQAKAIDGDVDGTSSITTEAEAFDAIEETASDNEKVEDDIEQQESIEEEDENGSYKITSTNSNSKADSHEPVTTSSVNTDSGNEEKTENSVEVKSEIDTSTEFPDVDIHLSLVGNKFAVRTSVRTVSTSSQNSETLSDIFQSQNAQMANKTSSKMSAKQRREFRKQRKKGSSGQNEHIFESATEESVINETDSVDQSANDSLKDEEEEIDENKEQTQVSSVAPPKRGQRGKMKKMKSKYKDQDDEERKFRMEILASAGASKQQQKKGETLEKGKPVKGGNNKKSAGQFGSDANKPLNKKTGVKNVAFSNITEIGSVKIEGEETNILSEITDKNTHEEDDDSADEDEEKGISEDAGILNSLTGQPIADDVLLFAVPVCAPYSCLINYKYKVKLTPGSTKRGKASQMALNVFQHDKGASQYEKDLIRSLKGIDISRNIPGKVKVLAPNLQKLKAR